MNVSIRHNGSNISSHVIEYEREHKICTGIGQLNIVIAANIGRTFEPWDSIDIWENGSFQVRYYVSSISTSKPAATITLECQDKSKRLVDYFIPDQYTIDYPSYTGYWIKKFLTEAGITYQFRGSDVGVLISNNTALGLTPAYEQIMQLLQLSGWYMYFDGNGVAKIGSLDTELSNVRGTYGLHDIISIAKISDDKMLRNRAVVWGAFDPIRNQNSYADLATRTRWNYDSRDLRAMVVSNGNIPNRSSAYGIASKLLKEFSRITVEKHLTVVGASNKDLGDVVRVRSHVYNGTGMITTFGVHMGKDGLTTNLILDERCPRLFGFFDFGDYVYVGTYGGGVWRKHIRFDPKWYDFSAGLEDDMAVTDLHINNDMFGSITASGGMYYATSSDGPWQEYLITSLSAPESDQAEFSGGSPGSGVAMTEFSGLMGRAVIVDKITNTLKYGIDTYSGVNYGDYFLMYSGIVAATMSGVEYSGMMTSSGVSPSGYRGWIVEYDPFTSNSGVYPISISGNFDIMVLDLENDGVNDYVSVRAGSTIQHIGDLWNYGKHNTQPFASTTNARAYAVRPVDATLVEENLDGEERFSQIVGYENGLVIFDNEAAGEMEIISVTPDTTGSVGAIVKARLNRSKLIRDLTGPSSTFITREFLESDELDRVLTAHGRAPGNASDVLGIVKLGTESYRVYYWESAGPSVSSTISIYYQDWDTDGNVLDPEVLAFTGSLVPESVGYVRVPQSDSIVIGDKCYLLVYYFDADPSLYALSTPGFVQFYVCTIDLASGSVTGGSIGRLDLPEGPSSPGVGKFFFPPGPSVDYGRFGRPDTNLHSVNVNLFQDGESELPSIVGHVLLHLNQQPDPFELNYYNFSREYLVTGNTGGVSFSLIYDSGAGVLNEIAGRLWDKSQMIKLQLTASTGVVPITATTNTGSQFYAVSTTNGFMELGSIVDPIHLQYANTYGLLNTGTRYVTRDADEVFYLSDATTLTLGTPIAPPAGYILLKPYSSPLYNLDGQTYFLCEDDEGNTALIPFLNGSFVPSMKLKIPVRYNTFTRGINIGGFFVSEPLELFVSDPLLARAEVTYVDMLKPYSAGYLVLQRDGSDFHIIQEASKPIRVDISNSSPLLTVQDTESTFKSHYIFDNEILTVNTSFTFSSGIINVEGSGVRDYRYTFLEVPSGLETYSGIETASGILEGTEKLVLYAMGSGGVYYTYTNDLSSGFMQAYTIPSGEVERIETSNFVSSGQYVFVTTSGDIPQFYQKDPMNTIFEYYSGLPEFRATIIRVDDRF